MDNIDICEENYEKILKKLKPKIEQNVYYFTRKYRIDKHEVESIHYLSLLNALRKWNKDKGNCKFESFYWTCVHWNLKNKASSEIKRSSIYKLPEYYFNRQQDTLSYLTDAITFKNIFEQINKNPGYRELFETMNDYTGENQKKLISYVVKTICKKRNVTKQSVYNRLKRLKNLIIRLVEKQQNNLYNNSEKE